MTELNEKLAKWAGFIFVADVYVKAAYSSEGYWIEPDNLTHTLNLPDFPHSLDACFKWLVHKLKKDINGYAEITIYEAPLGQWGVYLSDWRYYETAKTPALALCKAIEKLIDEEAKHETL